MAIYTVALALNRAYLTTAAVALRSLFRALDSDTRLDIRLLTFGLGGSALELLERSVGTVPGSLREVVVSSSVVADLKVDGHVTAETYLRLLMPSCLPDCDRALYLDADILVKRSISGLCRIPMTGAHLLAVPHASVRSATFSAERGVPSYRQLGIDGSTATFNAGVMVLDLERWRETNTTERILSYLRAHSDTVLWWDQDALNAILHDSWRRVDRRWNVMTHHVREFVEGGPATVTCPSEYPTVIADPWILHYTSADKPWHPLSSGPFVDEWRAECAQLGVSSL